MTRALGRFLLRALSIAGRVVVVALSAGSAALGGGSAAPSDPLPPRDPSRP